MKRLMPTGLPGPIVDEFDLGLFRVSTGVPSRISNFTTPLLPTTCCGGMPYAFRSPRPHELDAAAGDDERLEAVRPQIDEQLVHRLIDELVVRPMKSRMPRRVHPLAHDLVEFLDRHARRAWSR